MAAGETYLIGAYNPATVVQDMLRFKVTDKTTLKYKVSKVGSDQTWEEVPSDLICYEATSDDKAATVHNSCELFVRAEVRP